MVPKVFALVLEDFIEIIPTESPKLLPPRYKVDHAIELVPHAKPSAMTAYRMAPMELRDLRRQLDEMLE